MDMDDDDDVDTWLLEQSVERLTRERDHLKMLNEGLVNRLAAVQEAFHKCVNKMKVSCPRCGSEYDAGV